MNNSKRLMFIEYCIVVSDGNGTQIAVLLIQLSVKANDGNLSVLH